MSLIIETKTQPINQQNAPTNPTANSSIPLALGHIEFNIFLMELGIAKRIQIFIMILRI